MLPVEEDFGGGAVTIVEMTAVGGELEIVGIAVGGGVGGGVLRPVEAVPVRAAVGSSISSSELLSSSLSSSSELLSSSSSSSSELLSSSSSSSSELLSSSSSSSLFLFRVIVS